MDDSEEPETPKVTTKSCPTKNQTKRRPSPESASSIDPSTCQSSEVPIEGMETEVQTSNDSGQSSEAVAIVTEVEGEDVTRKGPRLEHMDTSQSSETAYFADVKGQGQSSNDMRGTALSSTSVVEVTGQEIAEKGQSSEIDNQESEMAVEVESVGVSEESVEIMDPEFKEMTSEEENEESRGKTTSKDTSQGQSQRKVKSKLEGTKGKAKEKKSSAEESYTIVIKMAPGGTTEEEPVTVETISVPSDAAQRPGLRPRKAEVKQIIVKREEEEEMEEDGDEDDQSKTFIDPDIRQRLIEQIISKEWAANADAQLTADEKATVEDLLSGRPVRPVERQKMRPWMITLLDKNNIPGLSWQNRRERIFRISWKHAAHNCFNRDRDSDLFERWAIHTGRHYEGNHKRWKANFRCALNSLPDVIELRDLGVRKGDNAFKVYKFLDLSDPVYKDRVDNKGKKTPGLTLKLKGMQQKNVSKTEKYLRTIITRRLKREADGTLPDKSVGREEDEEEEEEEDYDGVDDVAETVEISEETVEGGGPLQALLKAIELQQEKLAMQDRGPSQALLKAIELQQEKLAMQDRGPSQASPGPSVKRPGPTLNLDGQSASKRLRQDQDGNILIAPNMGGSIEQVDGNILLKLNIPPRSASIGGISTGIMGSTGVIGSSGGTYVMAVGSASNTLTTMSKTLTPQQGQGHASEATSQGQPGQPVLSVSPGGKITVIQMENQEGKASESTVVPQEIQNLLRQRGQGADSPQQGSSGVGMATAYTGQGIEQKITFPVGGKALAMAGGERKAEISRTASLPGVGMVSGNKEQKITIPLSQLAAMMGGVSQMQKYGITINMDGKGTKELSTVSTSLACGGSVLATGIPANLVPAVSGASNVNTTLQNCGQGQAYLTLMGGANQGQILTSAITSLGTMATGLQKSTTNVGVKNIPSTVLEAMDLKTGQLSSSSETQKGAKSTAGTPSQTLLSPTKHTLNKDLTSLAEALKTRPPQSLSQVLPMPTVVGSPSRITAPKKTATASSGKLSEMAAVKNKPVTRLLISGAATTASQTVRPAVPSVGTMTASAQLPPTYNLVFQPNTPLSTILGAQLSSPVSSSPGASVVSSTQVINLQNLTKQQLSLLQSTGVLVGQNLSTGQVVKPGEDVHMSPSSLGVTPPTTPQVVSPKSSTPRAGSPNVRPELMEQVTIDLKEIHDQDDGPPVEGGTTGTTNFSYSCLWCKIDFSKKIDLLQHFMNLHQDMLLVPGEHEVMGQGQEESQRQMLGKQVQSLLDSDALDLRTVKTELIEQAPDMDLSSQGQIPRKHAKTVKEALIRKKSGLPTEESATKRQRAKSTKKKKVKGEGKKKAAKKKATAEQSRTPSKVDPESNQSSMSAQSDVRPKYSLTSLIEALRDSIERDKSKNGDDSDDGGSSGSDMSDESTTVRNAICYDDLSPDSFSGDEEEFGGSESEAIDGDIQVSVKTFQLDGKTMFKCSLCSKVFSKTCTFARHAMVHSRMYPYQCGLCDEKCSDMRVLLRHLDWHGENVDCPCKKCERLHKYGDIKTIGEKTSGVSKFVCEICERSFISDVACKAHVNMHKRSGSLDCEVCNLAFQCNRALSKHRKSVHGIQFCPYCLETCTLDMASHMSDHEGVYMYRCGLCSDGYNSRPLLHEHLKIHTQFGQQIEQEMKAIGIMQRKSTSSDAKSRVETAKKSEPAKKVQHHKKIETPKVTKKETKKEMKKAVKKKLLKAKPAKVKKEQITTTEESVTEESMTESPAKAEATKVLPPRQKTRKCRWHDNDSVCERCDVMFVKKIAFGRKPKSRQGKESPRPNDSNPNSIGYEGDDEIDGNLSKKGNSTEVALGEKPATGTIRKVTIPESLLKAFVLPPNATVVKASSILHPASPQKSASLLQNFSPKRATIIPTSAGSPQLLKLIPGIPGKTVLIQTMGGTPLPVSLAQLEVKSPMTPSTVTVPVSVAQLQIRSPIATSATTVSLSLATEGKSLLTPPTTALATVSLATEVKSPVRPSATASASVNSAQEVKSLTKPSLPAAIQEAPASDSASTS